MQWNPKVDAIHSIEFYRMFFSSAWGKPQVFQGAVLFGAPRLQGCEVLRVITPAPDPQSLYEAIAQKHTAALRERLIFLDLKPTQVIAMLQSFCQQGLPLPSLFDGKIARFEGLTCFQQTCYEQTCQIPHGETRSYSWLASRMKKSGAERAVGRAMSSNPFPLFIPCHRVLKKDGDLGGYLGTCSPESWQLNLKKAFLDLEGLHQQPSLFSSLSYSTMAMPLASLSIQ